jgi:predicted ATPase
MTCPELDAPVLVANLADIHIDAGPGGRLAEVDRVIHDAATDMERRGVAAINVAGDLFEHQRSSAVERNVAARCLTTLAEVAPVLLLRGNHDGLGELALFRRLRTKHPVTVEEGYGFHVVGGVGIGAGAWPCKAALLAQAGTNQRAGEQALRAAFQDEMRGMAGRLAAHDGPTMLAAHAMVRGSRVAVGQPLVGCELEVTMEDIRLAGAPVTVLGHIHLPQSWPDAEDDSGEQRVFGDAEDDGDVLYTGSPVPSDFGDLGRKSYLLIGFDVVAGRWRPMFWRRVPTTATPLHLAIARWDGGALSLDGDMEAHVGADVKLRYSFPAADSRQVGPAAAALRAQVLGAGAHRVLLDPRKIATAEVRASQVAEARTVVDKLRAFWDLHGAPPAPDRIVARLEELHLAAKVPAPKPAWTRMRRLRFKGIRPFRCEVDLDFMSIDAKTVAFVGENGEGKSTLLELCAAVFPDRRLRTHGKLSNFVTSPDAFVEQTFDCAAGECLTVRQTFGKAKDQAQVLTADGEPLKDAEGKPVIPDSGLAQYDAWAKENLPDPEIYFASAFLAQERKPTNWLDLDDGPRKGVLVRVAGVEYLEALVKECGVRSRAAKDRLLELQGQADELRRSVGLPELYADTKAVKAPSICATPDDRRVLAEREVTAAQAAVVVAEHLLGEAEAWDRAEASRAEMQRVLTAAEQTADALDRRADEQRALLATTEALDVADRQLADVDAQIAGVAGAIAWLTKEQAAREVEIADITARVEAAEKEQAAESERRRQRRSAIEQRLREITGERTAACSRLEEARQIEAQTAEIRQAVHDVLRIEEAVQEAQAARPARLEAERELQWCGAEARERVRSARDQVRAAERVAADRAGWPAAVAAHEERRAALAARLVDLTARRHAADQKATALQHLHEHRAQHLRIAVDIIATDQVNGTDLARAAAHEDDRRLVAALAGDLDRVRAEVAELGAQIAETHREAAANLLPAGVPDDANEAQAAVDAAEAAVCATHQELEAAEDHLRSATTAAADAEAQRVALDAGLELDRRHLAAAQALAAKAPVLDAASRRAAEDEAALARLDDTEAVLRAELDGFVVTLDAEMETRWMAPILATLRAEKTGLAAVLLTARAVLGTHETARRALVAFLSKRGEVTAAAATLAEIERQRVVASGEEDAAREKLAATPLPVLSDAARAAWEAGHLSVARCRSALDAAHGVAARAEERRDVVDRTLTTVTARELEREAVVTDVEDWEDLAYSLGRNGIQADEVDAIGPRVAALATTFLHEGYGSRWTVEGIDTVGTCEAMIAVADEDGPARSDRCFSPGERGILKGAFALALATLQCQSAGAMGMGPTLFLDEAGSALSANNSLAWVKMIRKAVDIVGADKVLYVSHDPGAQSLADARVMVTKDRVWVE